MGEKPLGIDEVPQQTATGGTSARGDGPDFPWDRASGEPASAPPLGSPGVAETNGPIPGVDVIVKKGGR